MVYADTRSHTAERLGEGLGARYYVVLSRNSDMDFAEFFFHALR